MDYKQAKRLVGGTTVTAYRRIHEIVSSALDRAETALGRRDQAELLIDFSRCLILVKYQLARNQISKELASTLIDVINHVMEELRRNTANVENIRRARTLLDALAVLVYQVGRK